MNRQNSEKSVLAINSSNRKENTYHIIEKVSEILGGKGIETQIINLHDFQIQDCTGCQNCLHGNPCPIDDNVDEILEKLRESDGVILGSPVYMGNVTGRLKTLIDRTAKWFHRPKLVGKPSLLIATAGGSYLDYTADYLEKVAMFWGMVPTGKILRKSNEIEKEIPREKCEEFVKYLHSSKEEIKPSLKQLFFFQVQKALALNVLEADQDYWEEKGWDKKEFYFECSINPLKYIISKIFFKIMNESVKNRKINIY